jgi:DNA repair protein SbcC/Rad50
MSENTDDDINSLSSQIDIINKYLKDNDVDNKIVDTIVSTHKKFYEILHDDKNNLAQGNTTKKKWEILSLSFSNMLCYGSDNEIIFSEFKKNNVVGIFAPNHYGKSAVLDIILFCLFEKFTRGDKNEIINKNKNNMCCKITFKLDNDVYTIKRKGIKNINRNAKFTVSFKKNNEHIKGATTGVDDKSEINKQIVNIIGTYEDYVTTCFFLQHDAVNFIDMSQKQMKEYLNYLLKLDIFDEFYAQSKIKCKKYDTMEKELKIKFKLIDIDKKTTKIRSIMSTITELENNNTNLSTCIDMINLLLEFKKEIVLVRPDCIKNFCLNNISDIRSAIDKSTNYCKQNVLTENIISSEDYYNAKANYDKLVTKKKELKNKINLLRSKIIDESITNVDVDTVKQNYEMEKIKYYDLVNEKNQSTKFDDDDNMQQYTTIKKKINYLQTKIFERPAHPINTTITNTVDMVKTYKTELFDTYYNLIDYNFQLLVTHNTTRSNVTNDIGEIKLRVNLSEYFGKNISSLLHIRDSYDLDECKSSQSQLLLNDNSLTKEIQWLIDINKQWDIDNTNIINAADNNCTSVNMTINFNNEINKLNTIKKKIRNMYQSIIDSSMRNQIEQEIKNLMSEKKTMKNVIENIKNNNLLEEKISNSQLKLNNYERQIKNDENNRQILFDIAKLDLELNKIDGEINNEMKKISEYEKFSSDIVLYETNIKLANELTSYKYDYINWLTQHTIIETNKNRLCEMISEKKNNKAQIKLLNDKVCKIRCKVNDYLILRDQYDNVVKKYESYKLYSQLLKFDGLPYEILKNYIPYIEKNINRILVSMVDFTIDINFEQEKKSNIIIYIKKNNYPKYNIKLASGFEKFIIGISIRMVFSKISLKIIPDFIIIDEGWNCLDSDNLSNISVIMDKIKKQYKNVIIISHLKELKKQATHIITIKRNKEYSYIKNEKS